MGRKALLLCGILSSVLYFGMNVFIPMLWEDYSVVSQTISELSAIGAPTRTLWVGLGTLFSLLLAAFGLGVWRSAGGSRALRVAGALMMANGLVSLYWPPMHLRGEVFALTDKLHIVWTAVTVPLMLLAIGFAAAGTLGRWFRRYSIASLVVLLVFGVLTGIEGPRIAQNLPTPWIGVWERISIAAYMLWLIVLATALLRTRSSAGPG